mgnify:CR=1 FL=1
MKTSRSVLIPSYLGWFGKRIKCTKSWTTFIKNSRIKTLKSVMTPILFRLILRHLQHLDINCHRSKCNRMKCTKLKVKYVVFVYDDDWTLLWKISSGKNQNDMMNGDVLNLDFRTKTLTSKCGLLTNVLSRAMHFLMIIHNDEMWYYILYLSHEDIILKRFTYTQKFFLSKLTVD